MNRRILYPVLFLLLLAAVSPARGQRFEWATGYSGWDGCEVRGAVTDSRGNVYMIGKFTFGASWVDGEDLYPAGMARTSDGYYTVIAKVSPEGELVWKRIIATSDGVDQPFGIKMLGDSSLICLVSIGFPGYLHQQIYYLDTIVEVTDMYDTDIDYPVSPNYEGFGSFRTMGFITLDLDGNLREHHFIDETYLDADGNEYWRYNYRAGHGSAQDFMSFDVDHSGNVYLCQRSCDVCHVGDGYGVTMDASNGDIKGIRYWHNRDIPIGDIQIKTPTQDWFGRIVKFSPHFDTVLAVKYIFEATDNPNFQSYVRNIKIDRDNNVYIIDALINNSRFTEEPADAVISIDTALGMVLNVSVHEYYKGYMIQYDSNLVPQYYLDLQDSAIVPNSGKYCSSLFNDIAFDYDSNYLFLTTSLAAKTNNSVQYYVFRCQGINLEGVGYDQTLLVFYKDNIPPTFQKFGKVPSVNYSCNGDELSQPNDRIACANNRVVFQYQAVGGVRPPGGQAPFSDNSRYTLGHIMFDYQGNFIDEECYYSSSHNDTPGPVLMHDSSIYFVSTLCSNATYGDIAFSSVGSGSGVAIAKYVDTALMHPYETPRASIPPIVRDDILQAWPNPTTGPVNISISPERLTEAYLTDASGRREAVELKVKSIRRIVVGTGRSHGKQKDQPAICDYTLDLSGHRDGLYILTFVSDNGNRHSVKLLKWSQPQQ